MTDLETMKRLVRSVENLEAWKGEINVARAAEAERMARIDETLKSILGAFRWLLSIVAGAALVAFTQFILNGGFNIPT